MITVYAGKLTPRFCFRFACSEILRTKEAVERGFEIEKKNWKNHRGSVISRILIASQSAERGNEGSSDLQGFANTRMPVSFGFSNGNETRNPINNLLLCIITARR